MRQSITFQTMGKCVASVKARGFWDSVPPVCDGTGMNKVVTAQFLRLVEEAGEFQEAYTMKEIHGLDKALDELADMAVVLAQFVELTGLNLGALVAAQRAQNDTGAYRKDESLVMQLGRLSRTLRYAKDGDYADCWEPLLAILFRIEAMASRFCAADFNQVIISKLERDEKRGRLHGAAGVAVGGA